MKRMAAFGLFTLVLLGHGTICRAAAPGFQAGLWEMNMETKLEGLPFAMPSTVVTVKQCMTPEDKVPKDPDAKNCTFNKVKASGNKVSWEFTCNEENAKVTGKGEMTYSGTSCSGTTKTVIDSKDGKMTATTAMKGKRLGKCSGEQQSVSVNGQDVNQLKEQHEQVAEMVKKIEAESEADRQRSMQLIKQIKVPKEKADACDHFQHADGSQKSECDDRQPELAIREGQWEITKEMTGKTVMQSTGKKATAQTFFTPVTVERSTSCFSPFNEPVRMENMKRSGNTVTWKHADDNSLTRMEQAGGVEYQGNSYEGGSIETLVSGNTTQYTYTRLTGRRVGDGNCMGRDITSREMRKRRLAGGTRSAAQGERSPEDAARKAIENPVRELRSIFGF